VAGRRRDAS
jgi:hypothetical protein